MLESGEGQVQVQLTASAASGSRYGKSRFLEVPRAGQETGLVDQQQPPGEEGPEQDVLPEEVAVLLQEHQWLPASHSTLCCAQEKDQAGQLCGGHEAGLTGDSCREENAGQTTGHHG